LEVDSSNPVRRAFSRKRFAVLEKPFQRPEPPLRPFPGKTIPGHTPNFADLNCRGAPEAIAVSPDFGFIEARPFSPVSAENAVTRARIALHFARFVRVLATVVEGFHTESF
jgi:hypothetical protein